MSNNILSEYILLSKDFLSPEKSLGTFQMDSLNAATGPVSIPMTNDYLFRALLQRNNKVLRGLIGSLLHLDPEQLQSVEITNPIELGTAVDEKTFILDIRVLLNDSSLINLEMQVINEHDWIERSLSYLCRTFDNLEAGDDYLFIKPVIQIGLLDFTLFPKHPEFYSTNMLLNVKNHMVYSDKLRLSVVDLTHIDLATEEDKLYHIDSWAALFKAATWEEIKMLAQNNEYIQEATNTVYQLTQEERIRQQCDAREDYYRRQRSVQRQLAEQKAMLEKKDSIIADKDSIIASKDSIIEEMASANAEKDSAIAERDSAIAKLQAEIERLKKLSE